MDKQQAKHIIKETFENSFEKERFIGFIKNLLKHIEEDRIPQRQGQFIPEAYRQYISTLERIGKFNDGENRIDILIIKLQKETSIERARTMQRNFVAGYLQGKYGSTSEKEAALVAFVSPDEEDWRFSLVKMDYKFEQSKSGRVKVKEEFTPARRWSFLVGKNETSHTAQSRLVNILANDEHSPTLAELEHAFDIETVTKEFFIKYRELFIRTKEELDKIVTQASSLSLKNELESKGVDTVNFAKKLLGQIVFLYFLQKKGWFGVGRDDDWGAGSKHFLRELFEKKVTQASLSACDHAQEGSLSPEILTGFQTLSGLRPGAGSLSKESKDNHKQDVCDTINFFNDILEPLFYEALRNDRSHDDHYYSRFNCKIPFLNGGLFDPIGNYVWVHTDICLPDSLFSNKNKTKEGDIGDGILDIFDRYNFTVREDEPLEKEVAIDPELLGKAYEKFNAIRPDNYEEYKKALKSGKKGEENKFNKQYGVYYTPREIVHYMCKQSLINYLFTECNTPSPLMGEGKGEGVILNEVKNLSLSKEDIETLIHLGEQVSENEATALLKEKLIAEGRQKTTKNKPVLPDSIKNNAALLDNKLEEITVCDPAVGSGAFPVGMMSEIVKARNVLSVFLNNKDLSACNAQAGSLSPKTLTGFETLSGLRSDTPRTTYDFKRHCIEKSLYGVDIDPGAVEIAKLRLWLSLVVDEDDIKNIKPLPNLDYRIMQGNSLISEYMGINFDSDKEKNNENLMLRDETDEMIEQFQKKKDEFLNESNVSRKKRLKEEVDDLLVEIFEAKLKNQKADYFNKLKYIEQKHSNWPTEKQRNEYIKQDKEKLYKESGFNLESAEKQLKEFTSGNKIKPFFLWNLYFSEVFHHKGGFDVVIANPPYVQLQKDGGRLANMFKNCGYKTFERTGDIYSLFYEKGITLLKNGAVLTFITSNKWMRAGYGKSLRKYFNAYNPRLLIDLGPGIFESATVDTNILIIEKKKNQGQLAGLTLNTEARDADLSDFISENKNILPKMGDDAWFIGSDAEQKLKEKIEQIGKPLKEWDVNIYRGVLTGLNEAFIIDTATRDRLVAEDPKSAEILKPILRGRDIKRYGYEWAGLWLIASGFDIDVPKKYPAVFRHLKQFEEKAKKRDDQGQNWWNLRACAYYQEFEREKVVWARLMRVHKTDDISFPRFSVAHSGTFVSDSLCIITGSDLHYLTGVLNSTYGENYFRKNIAILDNGGMQMRQQYVENILIPPITLSNKGIVEKIERIVEKILSAKKQNPKADTSQPEREIDQMVYKLYDLTPEEIAIVEEKR